MPWELCRRHAKATVYLAWEGTLSSQCLGRFFEPSNISFPSWKWNLLFLPVQHPYPLALERAPVFCGRSGQSRPGPGPANQSTMGPQLEQGQGDNSDWTAWRPRWMGPHTGKPAGLLSSYKPPHGQGLPKSAANTEENKEPREG